MSPRYYIISALLVFALTAGISWWKQKSTKREIAVVLGQVILSLAVIVGVVAGVAKLMVELGIAQSGFVF
jgi:heme/copper-type cytochrome/quinol oxidase subunit 1